MNLGKRTTWMLKYQKAKAKLVEYNIPRENYPHFAFDSNDLSFPTTYIISKYSESVIDESIEELSMFEPLLTIAAQYYDAAVNSKDRDIYTFDFLLSGASAYFLSSNFGSAKVLTKVAHDTVDQHERRPQRILLNVYNYLLLSESLHDLAINDRYSKVNNAFLDCFEKGQSKERLIGELISYRKEIYLADDPDDVYYVDILFAIILRALDNVPWNLLPQYSKRPIEDWTDYLSKETSIKMLWPAQRLIGESGILQRNNAIVQLPTGVGKTKSIELIIRADFLSNRAKIVIIVAPLRALCNEITTDMLRAFKNEAEVNQFSDVLQEDLYDFANAMSKQILVCTPEKLSYVVHHDPGFLDLIDLFVFDEAHMFDDGERGAAYELLITHIKNLLSNEQQIILLSAVLPNAEEIKNWLFETSGVLATDAKIVSTPKSLGFASAADGNIVFYTEDPGKEDYYIPRIIKVERLENKPRERKQRFFPDLSSNKASIDIAIFNAIKLCNEGVAIYVGRQQTIKTVLERFLDLNDRKFELSALTEGINIGEANKLSNFIKEYYGEDHCYAKAAYLGVLPHSASVPSGIKLAVEYAIKNRHIKCVVCTSTLAQGVNIPIKTLLVTSIRIGRNLIKKRNFQNLIGRTARAGIYTEGNIIITDPKIYAEKASGAGWYRWNECIDLFHSNSVEKCSSSILEVTRDMAIDYETKISGEEIIRYILEHYIDDNCFIELCDNITNWYLKKKPQSTQKNIFDQLEFRKQVLSSIENYLCLRFSVDLESDRHEVAKDVCKNTLAYSLASDKEKLMLLHIFEKIEEKLAIYPSDQLRNYSYAMSGMNESLKIENWIREQELLEVQYQEQDLLLKITNFFKEDRKIKAVDRFYEICKMWIDGHAPFEISQVWKIDINDIDDICSKSISYELNFFIGNINDLLIIDEETPVNPSNQLSILQKKVKYGVPSVTTISICEKVFNDRVLSLHIENILGSTEIETDQIIQTINYMKDEVFILLRDYPQFFTDRLEFVLR
ncbi:DEAD/DEAH box helicase [Emergencia timonensis]|uniref:DEAD/DEAH box helicase n=1 Tax=Emergencia timonensis TaxID=1776384 RepID=UPI0039925DB5